MKKIHSEKVGLCVDGDPISIKVTSVSSPAMVSLEIEGNRGNMNDGFTEEEQASILLSLILDDIQDDDLRAWCERFIEAHRSDAPAWRQDQSNERNTKEWLS